MLTDTAHGPTDAAKFILGGLGISLGLFVLLRLNWIEAHVVLPFTQVQARVAIGVFGTPASPVEATLACSGTDALALCLGAILAYPVTWRARLAGAGAGAAFIIALNTVRIGSLGRVAASPVWFEALHIYVWPTVLTLAIAGYVFAWMRYADRPHGNEDGPRTRDLVRPPAWQPSRRFALLTITFLLVFLAASRFYLESASVLALAGFIARTAAVTLGIAGVTAHAAGNVLWTSRGGFLVTQECISTPLIPIYLAAICTYSGTWRRLILGLLATLPLFVGLGIVRLLVVAVPDVLASPLFLVHAFYQLLLGAVAVFLAARWRHRGTAAIAYALVGIVVGVLFAGVLGPLYTRMVTQAAAPLDDPQGALALLPAFQVGLYLALSIAAFVALGWPRFLAGLAVLGLTQTAGLLALQALGSQTGLAAHVRDVRGWAVAGPVVIFVAVVNLARPRR